jgi:AraC-like DNA-binding protein
VVDAAGPAGADWVRSSDSYDGVELLEAWFHGHAYDSHRHDSYAVGLTDTGVQCFNYRGAGQASTAGKVIVLHPDEAHDGHAGSADGFGYRMVYVEPARIGAAVHAVCGRARSLPFVGEAVSDNAGLARAVRDAFADDPEPLALDALVLHLAEGLLEGEGQETTAARQLDDRAVARAREFLDAANDRVVRTAELEAVSGLSRYDLARQFRALLGTSPYRYSLMRRLDRARRAMRRRAPLAEVAYDAGFADQAHFTRRFKAAYGMTPARYGRLVGAS